MSGSARLSRPLGASTVHFQDQRAVVHCQGLECTTPREECVCPAMACEIVCVGSPSADTANVIHLYLFLPFRIWSLKLLGVVDG